MVDADLSRAMGDLADTPFWRDKMSKLDGAKRRKIGRILHARIVQAGTIANLPDDIKEMIALGKRSAAIAKRRRLNPVIPSDLKKVMDELYANN